MSTLSRFVEYIDGLESSVRFTPEQDDDLEIDNPRGCTTWLVSCTVGDSTLWLQASMPPRLVLVYAHCRKAMPTIDRLDLW